MRIHYLQHVSFEGIGHIQQWADVNNHTVQKTELFNNQKPPVLDSFDLLIVMGGPMGIYDYDQHSWLKTEKVFISDVIASGKPILGICLGAQLIADVLGASVTAGNEKEIGWFPIQKISPATSALSHVLPEQLIAYHWHGDTFSTPAGAQRLYMSEACENQAFVYNSNVIALQFHLETTPDSMTTLIGNCGYELITGPYIQTATAMHSATEHFPTIHTVMDTIMDYLVKN